VSCDDGTVKPVRTLAALPLATLALVLASCSSTQTSGASGGMFGETSAPPAGWATQILEAHNRYRAQHCAPPLAWSEAIAAVAQDWADHLKAGGCKLEHSQGDLGENLAGGTTGAIGATRSVELWYAERPNYKGGFAMNSGHYSQLVWKGSERVGCGTASCGGTEVWVCNYDPPGNVEGAHPANVSPLGCK